MFSLNHDVLRTALTTDFNALSYNVTEAAQISLALNELTYAAKTILAELAGQWNRAHNISRRLPEEVLAMCFAPLSLCDAMAVTHVSRSWRAVAISLPALWTRIDLTRSFGDIISFLRMVISRTGQRPIDLYGPSNVDERTIGPLVSCLSQHMSHLRTIRCPGIKRLDLPFSLPAPLLEQFSGRLCDLVIPPDFLGGRAGSLRELSVSSACFPASCPALSTLSYLFIEFSDASTRVPEHAASFSRIFQLCPSLRLLSLRNIKLDDAHCLPTSPAPRTLYHLELRTQDPHYDLARHYTDWKSDGNLSYVQLEMNESTFEECRFQDLAAGTTTRLSIRTCAETSITAFGPAGAKCSVEFSGHEEDNDESDFSRIARLLFRARSTLDRVYWLEIPGGELNDLAYWDVFSLALPKLQELIVLIERFAQLYDFRRQSWSPLGRFLHRAAGALSQLGIIILDFTRWTRRPLTAEDARSLVDALAQETLTQLPDITIVGFKPDTVQGLRTPVLEGRSIEFGVLETLTDSDED